MDIGYIGDSDARSNENRIERKKGEKTSDESSSVYTHGEIDKIDSSFSVTSLLNLLLIGMVDTSNVILAIILIGPTIAYKIIITRFPSLYPYLNTRIGEK